MEKETSKKYEAAVAAFIKENKPKGTVVYDDLANQLATPYTLDAEAMEKCYSSLFCIRCIFPQFLHLLIQLLASNPVLHNFLYKSL